MARASSHFLVLTLCVLTFAVAVFLLFSGWSSRQRGLPLAGTIERITVYGESLAGNLTGDPPERSVSIYLPPSYASTPDIRFPVLYVLHGLLDSDDGWFRDSSHFINLPRAIERSVSGGGPEMIVVAPNAHTKFGGSMFSNSVTTGDWETFVARDLVRHVDGRYRTVASSAGRGLTGHSMGAYGALRIGMRFPDVFAAVYAQSPCCVLVDERNASKDVQAVRTFSDLEAADFKVRVQFAWSAAWAPNSEKPPFYLDLPFEGAGFQPSVVSRWQDNSILLLAERRAQHLQRLGALAIDAGDDDPWAIGVHQLSSELRRRGVSHSAEIYDGGHTDRIADRFGTHVLPFFYRHLSWISGAVHKSLLPVAGEQ
jgi:S-formylglutathione hydrolase